MIDVPSEEDVRNRCPIQLFTAPSHVIYLNVSKGVPPKEALIDSGWTCITVSHGSERTVTAGSKVGCRHQYSLKHIGTSTINKQLGQTIKGKCALECSEESAPFCKEQVVVGLSRTCSAKDTIIVGKRSLL